MKVTLSTPSGLLIIDDTKNTKGETIYICLLQHNIISLRPEYKRVKELRSVISPKECARIIQGAEAYAKSFGGWTNRRHTNYATTDIPVDKLYGEDNHIDELVNRNILPEIATYFGLNPEQLHIGGTTHFSDCICIYTRIMHSLLSIQEHKLLFFTSIYLGRFHLFIN